MVLNLQAASLTAGAKLPGIEGARGIAASLVVFYHAARHLKADTGIAPLNGVAQFGHAGVDFFFVLSGFIIYFVHNKDIGKSAGLGRYLERRFTRIFPLYWFVLMLMLCLTTLSVHRSMPSVSFILQSMTLLPHVGEPILGVAWTLQHEIIFYLLFSIAIINTQAGIFIFFIWLILILIKAFDNSFLEWTNELRFFSHL